MQGKKAKSLPKRGRTRIESKAAPVARAEKRSIGNARISQGPKSTRIQHTEWLGKVSPASAAYQGSVYSINPGLFPWAGDVASRYESYVVRSARFEYVPIVPTSTSGAVYLYADYDVYDDSPATTDKFTVIVHHAVF